MSATMTHMDAHRHAAHPAAWKEFTWDCRNGRNTRYPYSLIKYTAPMPMMKILLPVGHSVSGSGIDEAGHWHTAIDIRV